MKQMINESMPWPPSMSEGKPESPGVMFIILKSFGPFAILQIALAIFMLMASIYFLKLHAWARSALEFFCWLGIIYTGGFGIFWIFTWMNRASSIVTQGVPASIVMFSPIGLVIGIVTTALGIIPLIIVVKLLRAKIIREALR